ncbi:MAG TPA: cell envelope integrity protein CreD [Bryobacteraceae bacterium]|nr:cell envelope integrity protein CreD [Bryobacteraceae bacterium]
MQELSAQSRINSRSMGVKLIVVCGLAGLMAIPGLFVGELVEDRTHRAADVVRQITEYAGGPQTFLGPTLAIPLKTAKPSDKRETYLVFPTAASAVVKTVTEERRRSLFKVPVFQADVQLDAAFDLTGIPSAKPPNTELDWDQAEIVVGVSHVRGALADAVLTSGANTMTLVPAATAPDITIGGDQSGRLILTLLGARAETFAKPNARFSVSSTMRFSGAQRIAVLSYGKRTRMSAQGDWPSPGFDGGFLPVRRTLTGNAFRAEWEVPFIARGVRAEGPADSFAGLEATALGTSFVEVADPYQSVQRSQKYELLFVGLIFLSYFVFEVVTGKRVHPAQYILVGIAQIIFYLLLLSLAERIGFDWGFLVAGCATVGLLSANAGWVFSSRAQAAKALGAFSLLYVLIYLLLRVEDNALLVGAVASFLAVAVAMYLTRRIDWYSPFGVGTSSEGRRLTGSTDER